MRKLRVGILVRFGLEGQPEQQLFEQLMGTAWAEAVLVHSKESRIPFFRHVSISKAADFIPSRLRSGLTPQLAGRKKIQDGLIAGNVPSGGKLPNPPPEYDVVVTYSTSSVSRDLMQSTRFGIWGFQWEYGPNQTAGKREQVSNGPVAVASLLAHTDLLQKHAKIVGRAYYNLQWTHHTTKQYVLDHSPTFILKHLRMLHRQGSEFPYYEMHGEVMREKSFLKATMLYRSRSFILGAGKVARRVLMRLGLRPTMWSLFLGQGSLSSSSLSQLQEQRPPAGQFWADPFLFRHKDQTFVFFENYSYRAKIGKISVGLLENGSLQSVRDALVSSSHLSYPYVFSSKGNIFMSPETSANKRLEVWRAVNFPDKWELHTTAFEGEAVHDPTFFVDDQGAMWLFLNRGGRKLQDGNSELWIYQVDGPDLKSIVSHDNNPVIIDCRHARSAGNIFRAGNLIMRPSQEQSYGIYGYGLNMSVIKHLSLQAYDEEVIFRLRPGFRKQIFATHHLSQLEDVFAIDGCFFLQR